MIRLVNAGPILFAIIIALVVRLGVQADPLSRFEYIQIQATTDADTIVSVFTHQDSGASVTFPSKPIGGAILPLGGQRTIQISLKNGILGYFKLGFSAGSNIKIHEVRLLSHYVPDTVIRDGELQAMFSPGEGGGTRVLPKQDGIELRSDTGGMTVATTMPVFARSLWLSLVLPALLGGLAYLLARNYRLSMIPAFHDMYHRDVGERKYRVELDGLRGLAALSVVMEHTWWRFQGIGATGVWIFFVLSGFLLAQPFVTKPDRAIDRSYVTRYFIRRVARIVPMYYLTVLILFGMQGHADKLFDHFLFLQADGHLWTVQQEITFYLVLPLIVLTLHGVNKIKPSLMIGVLSIVSFVSLYDPKLIPIRLFGYGLHIPFFLGFFTSGMLISYLYSTGNISRLSFEDHRMKKWFSAAGFLLIGIVALFSINPAMTYLDLQPNMAKNNVILFGLASASILFVILVSHGTLLSKFFSLKLLRSIGVVGYSYYLLHPLVARMIIQLSEYYGGESIANSRLFIATAIATWVVSVFTYSLIEKPFMMAAKHYRIQEPGIT